MTTGRCLRPNGPYVVSPERWVGYKTLIPLVYVVLVRLSHQLSEHEKPTYPSGFFRYIYD